MPPAKTTAHADALLEAAATLRDEVDALSFAPPTACVYNPLRYAWRPFAEYVKRYGNSRKRVVFLGMNPGPWGMAQTGVPFGEISAVRDWIGVCEPVDRPTPEHPKRPITGFDCSRSEVSGRRLWGLFAQRFGPADSFFADHFVLNFCPLVWMDEGGRNRTPDKLPAEERLAVEAPCLQHLRKTLEILQPEWAVGIGAWAEGKIAEATREDDPWRITRILHPSPASPAANRGWDAAATKALEEAGVWPGA